MLQRLRVDLEFHEAVAAHAVLALGGDHGLARVRHTVHRFVDDPAAAHVRDQVGLDGVVHVAGEVGIVAHPLHEDVRGGLQIRALARHAGLVGADADVHAASQVVFRLIAHQRQRRALGHLRVQRREVVLKRHRHAAQRVVERRYAVQVHGQEKVDVDAQEQLADRRLRVSAALLAAVAEAVGQADLRPARTRRIAQHAQYGDLRHGVAVDLDRCDPLVLVVDGQQHQKIRLAAVAIAARFGLRPPPAVDAHQQDGRQPVARHVFLALVLHDLTAVDPVVDVPAHLLRSVPVLQRRTRKPDDAQDSHKQSQDQQRSRARPVAGGAGRMPMHSPLHWSLSPFPVRVESVW